MTGSIHFNQIPCEFCERSVSGAHLFFIRFMATARIYGLLTLR